MSSTPAPALMGMVPRIKRMVIALGIGVAVAVIAYYIAHSIVQPDPHGTGALYRDGQHKLVLYPAMTAAIAAAALTLGLLEARAANKWQRDSFARARVVKP